MNGSALAVPWEKAHADAILESWYAGEEGGAAIAAGDPLEASVRVTNTGRRAGDEVVQLYLEFPHVPGAPLQALRGFTRIRLDPGASRIVRFHLRRRDLSRVTETGDIIVAPGRYTVSVGGGQPGTGAPSVSGPIEIDGEIGLPQ